MNPLKTTVIVSKYSAGEFVQYFTNDKKIIGEIKIASADFRSPPDPRWGHKKISYWIESGTISGWIDEDKIICVLNTEKR